MNVARARGRSLIFPLLSNGAENAMMLPTVLPTARKPIGPVTSKAARRMVRQIDRLFPNPRGGRCRYAGELRDIYNGDDPLPEFSRYLSHAERRRNILPCWWTSSQREKCERFGSRHAQ